MCARNSFTLTNRLIHLVGMHDLRIETERTREGERDQLTLTHILPECHRFREAHCSLAYRELKDKDILNELYYIPLLSLDLHM